LPVGCLSNRSSSALSAAMHAPRDQHTGPAAHLEVAKELRAEDVLQRLPRRPLLDQLPQHRALRQRVTASRPRLSDLFHMLAQPSQLALRSVQVATGRQQSRQQRVYRLRLAEERIWDPWHVEGGRRMLMLSVEVSVDRAATTTRPYREETLRRHMRGTAHQPNAHHGRTTSSLSSS
jgi:hypothetical protein